MYVHLSVIVSKEVQPGTAQTRPSPCGGLRAAFLDSRIHCETSTLVSYHKTMIVLQVKALRGWRIRLTCEDENAASEQADMALGDLGYAGAARNYSPKQVCDDIPFCVCRMVELTSSAVCLVALSKMFLWHCRLAPLSSLSLLLIVYSEQLCFLPGAHS